MGPRENVVEINVEKIIYYTKFWLKLEACVPRWGLTTKYKG